MRTVLLFSALVAAACADAPAGVPDAAESAASGVAEAEVAPPDTTEAQESPAPVEAETPEAAEPTDRPQETTLPIVVEGFDDEIDVRLFETIAFPIDFSTYVPADWRTHTVATPGGQAVQFEVTVDALMDVFVPTDPSELDGFMEAQAQVQGQTRTIPASELPSWAREGYTFITDDNVIGAAYVGEYAGTPFVLGERFPAEFGDGFAPRAQLIRDQWRWSDGTPLVP
ncbi:MAG: hypothetical protein AAGK21_16225 [Bacteroidota bacterium]